MARFDVEIKHVRADGRIKILLRDLTLARNVSTRTILREPNDAAEFAEGEQVEDDGQGRYKKPKDDKPAKVR